MPLETLPLFLLILNLILLTNGERIVTDSQQIEEGTPLDYSYNETRTPSEGLISVPGCPKSLDGYPWVLFGEMDPRCYLVGEPGPCDFPTKLHVIMMDDSQLGICKFHSQNCEPERGERPPRPDHPRYSFCIPKETKCHELFYDNLENRVYPLYFEQGPCASPEEWPEPDDAGGVRCAPRKCPEGTNLITKESDKELQVDDKHLPCCVRQPKKVFQTWVTSIQGANCPEGQRYSEWFKRCYVPVDNSDFVIG